MVILVCLAALIPLAALAWRKGWKKKALMPVLFLVIIVPIDYCVEATLGSALSDISGFSLIVGIVCVAWLVYMVFKTPKTTALKK